MSRILLAVALIAASVAGVAADTRHTTEQVSLRKKPGEKEPVVATLPAQAEVTVISESGRWVKVRAKGAEGWVTRTTLDLPAATEPASTGAWSAGRRQQSGEEITELFVKTVAPSVLRKSPEPGADKVAELTGGARLVVVDAATTPGWIRARDDQGHDGWIARTAVDDSAAGVVAAVDLHDVTARTRASEPAAFQRPPAGDLVVHASAGVGYRLIGMDMTANGTGLASYVVDADAVAAVVGVDVAKTLTSRVTAGADARFDAADSSPGIQFSSATGMSGKIPFQTVAVDAGARIGWRVHEALEVAARGGLHYDAFLPANVDNIGMLPRERLLGFVLGVRADVLPPSSRFGAVLRFDWLAFGSRAQTSGLEDGTSSKATAIWGGASLNYLLGRHVSLFTSYDFGRADTAWSGASMRAPGVTSADRVDTTQLLQLGVSAAL